MNTMIKALVTTLAACFTALTLAACAAPIGSPDPTEKDPTENVDTAEQAVGNCSCWGYYTCPTNPGFEDGDYDAVGCGIRTKLQAQSLCKSHCNNVACIDSGWICP